MSSQAFFWINAGLGAALVLLFIIRRGPRQPTRLNLRAGASSATPTAVKSTVPVTMSAETRAAQAMHGNEKNLNILFNYNGHTWDAFEVLGVPAGAPLSAVEQAYKREIVNASESGRDFLDSAYQAIRSKGA